MNIVRKGAWTAPIACLLAAVSASAQTHHPTYFGRPGEGPSGPVYKYQHPYTYSILGYRYTKTAEDDYNHFLRQYKIATAQHIVAMNRLDWSKSPAYLAPNQPGAVNPVAYVNGNYGQGFGQAGADHAMWHLFHGHNGCAGGGCAKNAWWNQGGCGSCGNGGCGKSGCATCDKLYGKQCPSCGHRGAGQFGCSHCGKVWGHGLLHGNGNGMRDDLPGNFSPPYYSAYPGMNREDALRYVEGFQYYPPYQLLRSPRDFFMWDVRYNLGK